MTTKEEKNKPAVPVAAIDIGSNAIRLVVAQVFQDGSYEILENLQQALYLGQDTFKYGRLRAQTIHAAIMVLRNYKDILGTYGVEKVRAVATSAVREASNSENFMDRVFVATGLDIRIISSVEESRLNVYALRQAVGKNYLSKRNPLIVEVGGGSTNLNFIRKGEIQESHSLGIGSIRLQEVLSTSTDSMKHAALIIDHQINSAVSTIKGMFPLNRIRSFIALGGDMRWAANKVGKPDKSTGLINIKPADLKSLIDKYQEYTVDRLAKTLKIPFIEAETLVPALMVYYELLQATNAQQISVCRASMRDGLVYDISCMVSGKKTELTSVSVLNSARSTAEKFNADMRHANHVCFIAEKIYDHLQSENWININNRKLLQCAAILHEIGLFIRNSGYHKHSYYIIANTELFGLEPIEIEMVANIARYHRKSRPKASHMEYSRMNRKQRMIISKLAAILRIADALDVNRNQDVKNISCDIENDVMIIKSEGTSDLSLEKRAMASKGAFFEEIFGLRIRIE